MYVANIIMTDWSSRFDDNFWDDGGDDVDDPTPTYEGNQDHALKRAYAVGGVGEEIVGVVPGEDGRGGGGGGALHSNAHGRAHANAPSQPQSSFRCPNCNSSNIESLGPSGSSVCTDCGIIVEENTIVSTVEFVEGAGGSSSMVGQFVGANSARGFGTGGSGGGRGGGQYGFSRQSRENTLASGKRRIQEVAGLMRLGPHYVDSAHRLFTVAVERNFVQGRRRSHVIAACLYTSCRQEKSQHMLIDFSDALQVNVYTLGTCFLKFRRLLGLKLEIIDPALFIYRFAAHLNLDEKGDVLK
ncbi:hypothetical protein ACHAXA_002941 [Cyclostephanos tholiformis]|uniref:TFIIB-type domain-containing protein n=1 Tax=Cyclostephanos tholiformis TaxID=382380 RepID=A0ABD3RXS1_9STRA